MCDASVHDAAHDTAHDAAHDTSVISKQNLLLEFCADPKNRDEMQAYIDVSSRSHFSKYYLKPLLSSGKLEMILLIQEIIDASLNEFNIHWSKRSDIINCL